MSIPHGSIVDNARRTTIWRSKGLICHEANVRRGWVTCLLASPALAQLPSCPLSLVAQHRSIISFEPLENYFTSLQYYTLSRYLARASQRASGGIVSRRLPMTVLVELVQIRVPCWPVSDSCSAASTFPSESSTRARQSQSALGS